MDHALVTQFVDMSNRLATQIGEYIAGQEQDDDDSGDIRKLRVAVAGLLSALETVGRMLPQMGLRPPAPPAMQMAMSGASPTAPPGMLPEPPPEDAERAAQLARERMARRSPPGSQGATP